jgi:hypothetical protein
MLKNNVDLVSHLIEVAGKESFCWRSKKEETPQTRSVEEARRSPLERKSTTKSNRPR